MRVLDVKIINYSEEKGYKVKYSIKLSGSKFATIRKSSAWFKDGILSREKDNDKAELLTQIQTLVEKSK